MAVYDANKEGFSLAMTEPIRDKKIAGTGRIMAETRDMHIPKSS
jgi:hypothetical protein